MAVNEKDILEFDEMFDLSSDKSDDENEQTEEYGHSTGDAESFDDLASGVSEQIQDSDNKGHSLKEQEDPIEIIKDVISNVVKDSPVEDVSSNVVKDSPVEDVSSNVVKDIPVEDVKEESDDFFDDLPVKEKSVEKEEIIEDPINDNEDEAGSTPVEVSNSKCPPKNIDYGEVGYGDDKIEWLLDSPSSMYNSFYAKKRDLLFKYMVGGQAEYKRWMKELEDAQVIIRGEIFDHQLIINQMEFVQQHRERVKSIQVRVNNQYYTFKRFIELMRGFLARIEYLKPVVRQEGLIMEHMRDVELYYARLEALHESATKTEKTLEKAFDTLSRKCTICMELKPSERIEISERVEMETSSSTPIYVPSPPDIPERKGNFDEFDDLPSNAQAVPKDHKMGSVGWGDV